MDESFGASLRKERELRFIELEEISRATMISVRFLEAIENDDFDSLPHSTFVRGFLRAYAKYVGLNQDEVITNYEHYLQSTEEVVVEQPEEKTSVVNYTKLGLWTGILITLLVGGVLVYLALYRGEEAPSSDLFPQQPTVSTVAPSPEEGPGVESIPLITGGEEPVTVEPTILAEEPPVTPIEEALPITPPADESLVEEGLPAPEEQLPAEIESPPPPTPVAEEVVPPDSVPAEGKGVELVLKAIEESWILFQLDDEAKSDMIMQAGTSRTLNAQAKIVLTLGNAAGVELVVNGEHLPPLGKPGQVVRGLVFEARTEAEGQTIQNIENRSQNSE